MNDPKHQLVHCDEFGEIVQKPISFIPRINSKNEIERFIENQKEKQFSEMGQKHDPVNNPTHYTSDPSGIECIQITRHRNFNIGNAIKYLWRAGLKDGNSDIQDLQKAVWYIEDEIKRLGQTQCDI